jgi:hypothetical protein
MRDSMVGRKVTNGTIFVSGGKQERALVELLRQGLLASAVQEIQLQRVAAAVDEQEARCIVRLDSDDLAAERAELRDAPSNVDRSKVNDDSRRRFRKEVGRLRAREAQRLGRVDEAFIAWAAQYGVGAKPGRSLARHLAWLEARTCPVRRLSGTESVEALVSAVLAAIGSGGRPGCPESPRQRLRIEQHSPKRQHPQCTETTESRARTL